LGVMIVQQIYDPFGIDNDMMEFSYSLHRSDIFVAKDMIKDAPPCRGGIYDLCEVFFSSARPEQQTYDAFGVRTKS